MTPVMLSRLPSATVPILWPIDEEGTEHVLLIIEPAASVHNF